MTNRLSGLLRGLTATLLLVVLSACSKDDGSRILGRWRAERLQVQSISLPMGPEFVVTPKELISADGDIRIPFSSLQSEGNAVNLTVPLGIGLSFYFESADRIYFEMPLAGRVYFQRVKESSQPTRDNLPPQGSAQAGPPVQAPTSIPPAVIATPVISKPSSQPSFAPATPHDVRSVDLIRQAEVKLADNSVFEAETLLAQARRQDGDNPMIDYNFAVLRMRQGDQDAAVRSLRDAFEHGFRDFSLLDASNEFVQLKRDPRYNALLTRYR